MENLHDRFIKYGEHVQILMSIFDEISFHHISREEYKVADALATLSYLFKAIWPNEGPTIIIEQFDEPAC